MAVRDPRRAVAVLDLGPLEGCHELGHLVYRVDSRVQVDEATREVSPETAVAATLLEYSPYLYSGSFFWVSLHEGSHDLGSI